MRLIKNRELLNITTSLSKNDYPSYDSTKVYNAGDKVTIGEKNWFCTKDKTKDKKPNEYENILWISQPINAYAMFDAKADTKTKFTDTLTCSFDVEHTDRICFFGLDAKEIDITVENISYGEKKQIKNLKADVLNSFADYLFAPFTYLSSCTFSFPLMYKGKITVNIKPKKGKTGYLTHMFVGKVEDLGLSLYGGKIGIKSFTKKVRNAWGDMKITKGNTYNIFDVPVMINNHSIDYVFDTLKEVEAQPCVFLADESEKIKNLKILGTYRDLEIPIVSSKSIYNLRIESII